MKSYQPIVCNIVKEVGAKNILDMPSGSGWLAKDLNSPSIAIDGIDLFNTRPEGYRNFYRPISMMEFPPRLGNTMPSHLRRIRAHRHPGLILKTVRQHLKPGGTLVRFRTMRSSSAKSMPDTFFFEANPCPIFLST